MERFRLLTVVVIFNQTRRVRSLHIYLEQLRTPQRAVSATSGSHETRRNKSAITAAKVPRPPSLPPSPVCAVLAHRRRLQTTHYRIDRSVCRMPHCAHIDHASYTRPYDW